MRTISGLMLSSLAFLCLAGCAAVEGNRFNPYIQSKLASSRGTSDEQTAALQFLGGHTMTLQAEAAHRRNWKEEVYPVVFGDRAASNEILVFLDYASPESQRIWQEVLKASRMMDASRNKIVVFGNSREKYGTELMGGGIWVSYNRPQQAMEYFTYTLSQWNDIKARQIRQRGRAVPFVYEYDATASSTEKPILYAFLEKARPPVSAKILPDIVKYSYDAGNVNLYQAVDASRYYGVQRLPAVVVNERPLSTVTAQTIVSALK